VWPRERVKADKPHGVPLSRLALDILKTVPRLAGSPYVLTTNGAAPSNGFAKNKRKLDGLLPADMTPWRLHDLRRTCVSGMARLGIPVHVTEAVLNHRSGTISGVAAVYNRYDYQAEKARALEAWGQHIDALVSGKPAKVVRLREKRRGRADGAGDDAILAGLRCRVGGAGAHPGAPGTRGARSPAPACVRPRAGRCGVACGLAR
jgi:hypothetical protein